MSDDAPALIEPLPSGAAVQYIRDSTGFRIHELTGTRVRADVVRPVTGAEVEVLAEPVFQGRTQQLWEVSITRVEDGKLVARGRLRLQNLPLPD